MKLLKLFALFSLILFTFETRLAIKTHYNSKNPNWYEADLVNLICIHYTGNTSRYKRVEGTYFYFSECVNDIKKLFDLDGCTSYEFENSGNAILVYIHTGINANGYDFSHLTILEEFKHNGILYGFHIACVGKNQVKENNNGNPNAQFPKHAAIDESMLLTQQIQADKEKEKYQDMLDQDFKAYSAAQKQYGLAFTGKRNSN
jgi:hypothetical protein